MKTPDYSQHAFVPLLKDRCQDDARAFSKEIKSRQINHSLSQESTYITLQIQPQQVKDYLNFAQQLMKDQRVCDQGLLMGESSAYQIEERALLHLRSMNYNITKSKFSLLFPTILHFNQLQPKNAVSLSEQDMLEKIELYSELINDSKVSKYHR